MRLGIIGAGNIAKKMAYTVNQMKRVEMYAIGSRSPKKAKEFAKSEGVKRAYGSYEELVADPKVDLVYIASPHSHHYEHMMLALEHNKPVLCEKAFTTNAEQARKVIEFGQSKNLLVAEAIWTRYLPMRLVLDQILERRVIGEVHGLHANLCYPVEHIQRVYDPALSGGALLDLGVYTINFALMVLGDRIKKIDSTFLPMESGVDHSHSITMTFEGGKLAMLHSSVKSLSNRTAVIFGTRGYIEFININHCEGINVYDRDYNLIETYKPFKYITGFEHQVEACRLALQEGAIEVKQMPHSEIIRVMDIMDQIRGQWGLKYPGE